MNEILDALKSIIQELEDGDANMAQHLTEQLLIKLTLEHEEEA